MRRSSRILVALAVLGAALLGYLAAWPVPIEPVAWDPPADPGLTGPFAANETLASAERLLEGVGIGPEDVALGPDGHVYTGFDDGRIVHFDPDDPSTVVELANTGGRPLGLEFDAAGKLIVADALRGLLSIDASGVVEVLADRFEGRRMLFVDDLDIADDGTIWFSDASTRFDIHHVQELFLEHSSTGRLLSYDPSSGQLRVRLTGLAFANGVALGPNQQFVLVNESMAYRVTRLWLVGPHAGRSETFIGGLPGLPDNVSFNGRDRFWLACFLPRTAALDAFARRPFLRKVLRRLQPLLAEPELPRHGLVFGLDLDGNVVANLQDASGSFAMTTSANEIEGSLYVGSIAMPALARLRLDDAPAGLRAAGP
jgi:sugar lactone lactonase YvrE